MLTYTAPIAAMVLATTADKQAGAPAPRVAYTMTFDFRHDDPRLQVRVLASGLDPALRDVSLCWTVTESGPSSIRCICVPRARPTSDPTSPATTSPLLQI
jgi:hypothetical protein